ncbi:para-aminobenzoate synthetase / 4-amino-4-deoxychorismate lyase [Jatrophihabitans endophyticus]|uniref:Para-aminobenzoate synthetase / 4-amino-4-deoxychorismate lyase n=1 Tax=Jatrophihabitans endophyticus TaxID=1206085 RepID=A0A1M5RH96_9ACTN|nr:chorismate-binding protein [Jatrophihabitans endophyticus]SHH25707.1 para-aminobenzoate synthetase / 4-amino-4-deoxychorismate lyase [Jatrophihabitans endophyticus]
MTSGRARAVRVPLGAGPAPDELVRRAAGWPGLAALTGDWLGDGAIVAAEPVRTTDDLAEVAVVPAVGQAPPGFVGGGWFGGIDYDGTARFGFHDHVLRHRDRQWVFEALWRDDRDAVLQLALDRWRRLLTARPRRAPWTLGPVSVPDRSAHLAAVERAVELIRAGELYQVNVCTRLRAPFAGSAVGFYADLVAALRPARGALLTDGRRTLVGVSPELFLAIDGDTVRTSPIKGTLPRIGSGDVADGNDRRLRASTKDAAENVMIVDLVRNDLGRVCEIGSVRVDALLDVEAHPGVWHLVSTVSGTLRPDVGVRGLLGAAFPPGSVTGAPKLRALSAVAELEAVPRGAYTGAAGVVTASGRSQFAVTIRTFEIADGRAELGVGGGITADSVPMLEWRECRTKAAPLLRVGRSALPPEPVPVAPAELALLETVLAVGGVPVRLADHLARLDRSARELTGQGVPAGAQRQVRRAAASPRTARAALRIVLRDGELAVTAASLGPPPGPSAAVVCHRPAGLWRHKWADRSPLAAAEEQCAPAVPLFVAADGTVLETARGNVFLVREDGGLVTAPLRDDLLPGVTRRAVLDLARDTGLPTELREFTVAELVARPAFWTSSLSGAVAIRSVDGQVLPDAQPLVAGLAQALLGGNALGR